MVFLTFCEGRTRTRPLAAVSSRQARGTSVTAAPCQPEGEKSCLTGQKIKGGGKKPIQKKVGFK